MKDHKQFIVDALLKQDKKLEEVLDYSHTNPNENDERRMVKHYERCRMQIRKILIDYIGAEEVNNYDRLIGSIEFWDDLLKVDEEIPVIRGYIEALVEGIQDDIIDLDGERITKALEIRASTQSPPNKTVSGQHKKPEDSDYNRIDSSMPYIFIGHGRSPLWARLQIFLEKDLHLLTINYESESRVGRTIIPILEEMLNKANFAVLILTAEDETVFGSKRARQNVIHEAGLFQGKLGFEKAILLVQEGLEEFTNVAGLQCIMFTGERIEQTFYELRRVLERENLLH